MRPWSKAVLAGTLSTLAATVTTASAQQATPTTDLGVMVLEQGVFLPIPRVSVCVTPDASEPAFWGSFTSWVAPGVVVMEDIPVPPGMSGQPVIVTVARPDYQTVVEQQPLSAFVPQAGQAPGQIQFRIVRMPRGGPSAPDCGTPPPDPLGPTVALLMTPRQWSANVGDRGTFRLDWSKYAFAAPWYLYEWVVDDPGIAAPVATSQGAALELEALAPGTTRLTAYLLRPDGSRKPSESARIEVLGTRPPPTPPPQEQYTFGWETAIDQRAASDFNLPHACAVGMTLQQIVHARPTTNPPGCSIRTIATETCSSCHRMGGDMPTLQGIQKGAFCNLVPTFIANPSAATDPRAAKPQNLKDFFGDWYGRRDPATQECPD